MGDLFSSNIRIKALEDTVCRAENSLVFTQTLLAGGGREGGDGVQAGGRR